MFFFKLFSKMFFSPALADCLSTACPSLSCPAQIHPYGRKLDQMYISSTQSFHSRERLVTVISIESNEYAAPYPRHHLWTRPPPSRPPPSSCSSCSSAAPWLRWSSKVAGPWAGCPGSLVSSSLHRVQCRQGSPQPPLRCCHRGPSACSRPRQASVVPQGPWRGQKPPDGCQV